MLRTEEEEEVKNASGPGDWGVAMPTNLRLVEGSLEGPVSILTAGQSAAEHTHTHTHSPISNTQTHALPVYSMFSPHMSQDMTAYGGDPQRGQILPPPTHINTHTLFLCKCVCAHARVSNTQHGSGDTKCCVARNRTVHTTTRQTIET